MSNDPGNNYQHDPNIAAHASEDSLRDDLPLEDAIADPIEDKRKSPRFSLRTYADMQHSTKKWEAHLIDISTTGVRMAILDEHLLRKGDALRVHIGLDDHIAGNTTKKELHLHGKIAHIREHIVGIECQPDTPADKELLEQLLATMTPSQGS